jgi:hypothetical protein
MVAVMLISNSWMKARGIIPLKRKLFQQSGCKRHAGIFGELAGFYAALASPMISFDAGMPKKAA